MRHLLFFYSNPVRFRCEPSKSMSITDDAITIRQAIDSDSSEYAAIAVKSLLDAILTPGKYTNMIIQKVCMVALLYHIYRYMYIYCFDKEHLY
jgi:hypothetical protein